MAKTKGYSATAKSLHWLIVVLLAAQFTVAWLMPHIGRNTPVTTLISLHFSFGVIILLIAIIRLAWRATHAEPAPLDGVPPWQVQSARNHSLAALFAASCLADTGMDQRFMARHADCDVWAGIAEAGRHACTGLGLDRRRTHAACLLRNIDANRPARRVWSLPLFHSSRPCFAANASRRMSFRASPSPSASSPPRSVRARVLRAPRFCALPPGPCK